jgi:hypothetical protein
MAKDTANSEIVRLIYKLAGDPSRVKTTQKVVYDMMLYDLTVKGVCEAIREWIESGETVTQGITKETEPHIRPHIGKLHYIMKPRINGQKIYIKVGIEKSRNTGEYMLIISSHT